MQERRLSTTLKNLALALLNATLILIAICLFLGWQLAATVNNVTAEFAQNLIDINPLRDDILAMTTELQALRADLATVRSTSGDASSEALQRVSARLDAADQRLTDTRARIDMLLSQPELLIDHAVRTAADAATQSIADLRGCVIPPAAAG